MSKAEYSLTEIERTLHIKAQTLRTWEKRYGLIQPKRNQSNCRYYTETDKELLSNILLLKEHGYKLRNIAKWEHEKIYATANQLIAAEKCIEKWLEDIIEATLAFDKDKILDIFTQARKHYSNDCLVFKVIKPLFNQFNVLWLTGAVNSLHERFLGQLVCQYLFVTMYEIDNKSSYISNAIILSPDGAQKEYQLRMIHYLLERASYHVTYLGCNVSIEDLDLVSDKFQQTEWIINLSEELANVDIAEYAQALRKRIDKANIHIITNNAIRNIEPLEQIHIHERLDCFIQYFGENCNIYS